VEGRLASRPGGKEVVFLGLYFGQPITQVHAMYKLVVDMRVPSYMGNGDGSGMKEDMISTCWGFHERHLYVVPES